MKAGRPNTDVSAKRPTPGYNCELDAAPHRQNGIALTLAPSYPHDPSEAWQQPVRIQAASRIGFTE
jgi:hypothetical protein